MLAAKRCCSNIASYSMGFCFGIDVSGKTVRTWEVKLRAGQIVGHKSWMQHCYNELLSPFSRGGLRLCLHHIRADATIALLWQKSKLHCMEVSSVFLVKLITDSSTWEEITEAIVDYERTIICDVHVIKGTDSGVGMVGLIEAHQVSVGAPTFTDSPSQWWLPDAKRRKLALADEASRADTKTKKQTNNLRQKNKNKNRQQQTQQQ